jgi:hypothetical protein
MPSKADRLLFIALILAILFHGSSLLYNVDKTYDAFVHIFFADHYARSWFEPWEYRWYTGFPTTSYPPLSHQLIALLSKIGGLKFGFIVVILSFLCFFIVGIYRFAQLWVPKRSAGYAAVFAVVASSIVQTIHIYGQLPTMLGIACLMNTLPEIYAYFRTEKKKHLILSLSILGVTVASHHVTTIFGMVFFIAPIIATALLDENGTDGNFFKVAISTVKLAFKKYKLFIIFFSIAIFEMIFIIFPYWFWSKTDPITQVSIPHGSRDSFIEVTSSGLMFFIIPMGFTLLMLPYIFKSLFVRRNIFLALSFSLLLLLGTGGTTPIPIMILGKNAFNILTLDRFTFWASVVAIPFVGDFFRRLIEGDIRERIINKYSKKMYHFTSLVIICAVAFQALFIINFHKFRSLQPATIDIQPILQFLERDQHDRWRFMTLGFGDQMAWLSANTSALSIDGNYHSARRVPEMTTRPLERLENSKFKGIQGVGSLQQFLTIPEKYYLKFIFSNDKFYDPILYFAGWERVQRLENGIMIWQKHDVPPLPSYLPKKNIPAYQKIMWGIVPCTAFFIMLFLLVYYRKDLLFFRFKETQNEGFVPAKGHKWLFIWMGLILIISVSLYIKSLFVSHQKDPETVLKAYYNALDFKYFKEASTYFVPNSISFDEYVLQLSVRDGLLASYGKLEDIKVEVFDQKNNKAKAKVMTYWNTPLETYHFDFEHELIKIENKWYIKPPVFSKVSPPDEHMEKGILALHSQGKRNIGMATTEHDDVLDRPEMNILSAKLIKYDTNFVVVGEVQNIDHLAAHLTIESQLFDKFGKKLVSYNAKYTTVHKVLPKEIVPFRIEFEQTAWVKTEDNNQFQFNPKEFTAFDFTQPPTDFKIVARAVVADKDIYRDTGIQAININPNKLIEAEVFNFGTEEISVPQVLFTYYDADKSVRWVDFMFLKDGIRPQSKLAFEAQLPNISKFTVIKVGKEEDFYINGLPQTSVPNHYKNTSRFDLTPVMSSNNYIRMIINAYIANPTVY